MNLNIISMDAVTPYEHLGSEVANQIPNRKGNFRTFKTYKDLRRTATVGRLPPFIVCLY